MSGGHHRTGAPAEESAPTVQEIVERSRAEGLTGEHAAAPSDRAQSAGEDTTGAAPEGDRADPTGDAAPAAAAPPAAAPPAAGPPAATPRRPASRTDLPPVPGTPSTPPPSAERPAARPARPATGSAPLPPAPYGAVPPPLAAPSSSALAGHPTGPPRPGTRRPPQAPPSRPVPPAERPASSSRPTGSPVATPGQGSPVATPGQGSPDATPDEGPPVAAPGPRTGDRGPSTRVSPLGAALAPPASDRPRSGEQPGLPVLPRTPSGPAAPSTPAPHRPEPSSPEAPAGTPPVGEAGPRRDRYVQPVEDTQLIPVLPPVPSRFEQQETDPGQPTLREEESGRSRGILRAAGTMAVASLVSRITGFLRTVVLTAALGLGLVNDAYTISNTLPNIVYELLIGGVLTSVVVPLLVSAQEKHADRGVAYTQRLFTLGVSALAVLTVVAVLAAPALTWLMGIRDTGGNPEQVDLANWLARILLVEIVFYGIGAFATAALNARQVFGPPAWAPVLNNVVVIGVGVVFLLASGPGDLTPLTLEPWLVWLLGIGTTVGIALQALVLLPLLPRHGIPLRPRWGLRGTGLGEAGSLGLWVIGYVLVSQVGVVVASVVANAAARQEGGLGPAAFSNASLLFQMPYGIIGVALLTALLPRMSRAAARRDVPGVVADLSLGMRLSALGLLPVTALLVVLGPTVGTLAFARGNADPSDARAVGVALAVGAFGLLPMAVTLLQLRVFYAMKDARTPTLIQVAMVAVRVPLLLLVPVLVEPRHVVAGLMVATSVTYLVGWVAGDLALRRRLGTLRTGDAASTVLRVLVVSIVAAAAGWGAVRVTSDLVGTAVVGSLVTLAVGTVVVGAVVVGGVVLARVPEVAGPVAAVRARLGRPRR
ncbi:murein biosynthesis integral membrane protein MurJ [Modestobacter sp. Leaf380]|uniref:murein biosynthesis integral membrane protein MurJ n=1 Tax=Modestobacter sp. Leaf380 TaxID=1736356 RepID=UPI0006F5DFC5|nr:murein biosynthesis integral membrane protein MurJ [Modestobacter sp. Leaf380]KQS66839.1 hypothetical protein ASG41_10540 [Modestobacter sp. Leaf380]